MKNLLNLKGLCRSSQLAVNSDGQTTVERRSNDGHVRRHLPVGLTKLLSLFLLLTLGVGQMWAEDGWVDNANDHGIYLTYTLNGVSTNQDGDFGSTGDTHDFGTLTSDLIFNKIYFKVWWTNWTPTVSAQLVYKRDNNAWEYPSSCNYIVDKGGNNHEVQYGSDATWDFTLASITEASGQHTIEYDWKVYMTNTTHSRGNRYFTYTILPPDVDSYGVTLTNQIGNHAGTVGDPYIIAYGATTQFTVTATKMHDDPNSVLKVSFDNGSSWSAAADATTTSVTSDAISASSTPQSKTFKIKHSNGELDCATISEITVYYIEQEPGLTIAAGTNGQVSKNNSDFGASAQYTGITAGTQYNIYARPNTHYDFYNWTSSDPTHTTFGNNSSGETYATLSAGHSAVTTVTANFVEHPYAITINGGTESSTTAGISGVTGTATANAPFGKYFTNWTVPASNFNFASGTSSNNETITFNATADGEISANFGQKYAYLVGRFYVNTPARSGWTCTFTDGNSPWNDASTRIPFSYDEANHRFYLHTYGTPKELSQQLGNDGHKADPWFFVKTTRNSGVLNDATLQTYQHGSDASITGKGTENKQSLRENQESGSLKISSTDKSGYVLLYFDGENVWYDLEHYLEYAGNSNTGGSVPAERTYYLDGTNVKTLSNTYEREGYTFTGWLGSNENSYAVNADVTIDQDITLTAQWSENLHSVNIEAGANGSVNVPSVNNIGIDTQSAEITATPAEGYHFVNWTGDIGNGVTLASGSATSKTITIKATADGKTITANFAEDKYIYFDNTYTQWDNVYVYFFNNEVWYSGKGVQPKVNRVGYGQMTLVEGEDNLYQFAYHSDEHDYSSFEGGSGNKVAFSSTDQSGNDYFHSTKGVYRGDWRDDMPIFVAPSTKDNTVNNTDYYSNHGYWMMKNTTAGQCVGYELYGGSTRLGQFEAVANGSHVSKVTYRVDGLGDIYFYVNNWASQNYSCQGKVFTHDSSKEVDIYHFETFNASTNSLTLKPNVVGDYTFTLTQGLEKLTLTIDFPVQVGDHRLVYTFTKDKGTGSAKTITRYSDVIGNDETSAITSMYINKDDDDVALKLQECTSIDGVTKKPVWGDVAGATGLISSFAGKTKGVYQFTVNISDKSLTDITPYSGDYYIKTDCAPGGWANFTENVLNQNTISYNSSDPTTYDYYFCRWINNTSTNVRCVIANRYNNAISDTLFTDAILTRDKTEYETLPEKGSVRFSWNSSTNELKRTYLLGANDANSYLYILPSAAGYVYVTENSTDYDLHDGSYAAKRKFKDNGNWTYQMDVKVYPGATGAVKTDYPSFGTINVQELLPSTHTLMGGTKPALTPVLYPVRLVYDFKTNYLMSAYIPDGNTINSPIDLQSDMMYVRSGENYATQLSFSGTGSKLTSVKRAYAAIQLPKDQMAGQMGSWNEQAYKYCRYYISFPFEVKVSDIFGVGSYGDQYIIQMYNGAKRAQQGWFMETETFWETLTIDSVLHANQGYSLMLDRNAFNDAENDVWTNIGAGGSVYLYFPSSSSNIGEINGSSGTITVPAHECKHDRTFGPSNAKNHKNTDSNWNLMGLAAFANVKQTSGSSLPSYYEYQPATNTWSAKITIDSNKRFKSMHAYMVQWAGIFGYEQTPNAITLALVAARRTEEVRKSNLLQLGLHYNGEEADHAYVYMKDGANKDFVLNEDMMKMTNSGKPNIYVFAGGYDVAYSQVPVENQTIPVGVIIRKKGTYTFSMPSNFDGTVTLIDKFAQTRTNLALGDYEVALERGTINDRFELEINIRNVPTAIDGVTDGSGSLKDGKAHKFIENGAMYILREGQIYDARGNKVK